VAGPLRYVHGMIRLAHATDIHWFVPPRWSRLASKRLLGTANLYLGRRRRHFSAEVQAHLVRDLATVGADAIILTGDLTAQALPEEFALARESLEPLMAEVPTLVQIGNHDVYTGGSHREGRIREWFADVMHIPDGDVLARLDVGPVTVLGLDPNRPHWSASGVLPQAQLDRLAQVLDDPALEGRPVVLGMHYPLVDRRGHLYDGRQHGLRNAGALMEVLRAARNKPVALLHGHKHHGYRVPVDLGGGHTLHVLNPGAGGYAYEPHRDRAACLNVVSIRDDAFVEVERYRYDGTRFAPEPGGAYATGR
jgi:3',5'-cyclic AMP phosphodiesterase CpdA